MLLANGHILVVKEKDPLTIIEFAPKGSLPSGYQPSLSIEKKGVYPLGALSDLFPVAVWNLTKNQEDLFEDSSGLNVDSNGTLYLLGDQKNMIGRIGDQLNQQSKTVSIDKIWSLPSMIKQPEGMVIDSSKRPIIAIDRKKPNRDNLFVLTTLEDSRKVPKNN